MELRKYKKIGQKKLSIILFTIICILCIAGVIFYQTYAIYEVSKDKDLLNGDVKDIGNIEFLVYVDDTLQKNVPDKDSGYSLDTNASHCENGSLVSWDNNNWEVKIKGVSTTKTKCYLYFKEIYQEGILDGAIPDLGNGRLVPITFDESNGTVKKADITSEWYSYTDKQWANAVILKDQTKTYKANDPIPESNIESYFVWIPRYRYQIWNGDTDGYTGTNNLGTITDSTTQKQLNSQQEIQIIFENKDKVTPSNGSTVNSYLTHPAFISFHSNGMWVGKFETGYNQNHDANAEITDTSSWSKIGAESSESNSEKVIIKPNVFSWRNINVANAFYTCYYYQRDLESHMMKNMEWGAVAYLTYSKYGRCSGTNCTDQIFNNSSNYVTGYSANKVPTCGLTYSDTDCNKNDLAELNQDGSYGWNYTNPSSVAASTTGNYYGIFDMSGGAWETPFFANHQKTPVKC